MVRVKYKGILKLLAIPALLFIGLFIFSKTFSAKQDNFDDYEADLPHKESRFIENKIPEPNGQNLDINHERSSSDYVTIY